MTTMVLVGLFIAYNLIWPIRISDKLTIFEEAIFNRMYDKDSMKETNQRERTTAESKSMSSITLNPGSSYFLFHLLFDVAFNKEFI
jgi:hypothetical protein